MIKSTRAGVMIASAAVLIAATLSVPAAAEDRSSQPTAGTARIPRAGVPVPKPRPAHVGRRLATPAPAPRTVPGPFWFFWPVERVAVAWPMLMIGVGF